MKNHFRADGALCVIEALQHMQARALERWQAERHDPLLWRASGKPLRRHEVQAPIMQAALALEGDPSLIGTHSLRFGGASALWVACRDSAVVKRWGRWASEAFQGYLWEARGNAAGVAAAMAGADLTQIRGYVVLGHPDHAADGSTATVRSPPTKGFTRLSVSPLPRVRHQVCSGCVPAPQDPKVRFHRLGTFRRGIGPSDSDGSHTSHAETGTFCASRRPSFQSNRHRVPRHLHYPSRAHGLIAFAVKKLPRTRGIVGAVEAAGRLACVTCQL